MMLSPGETVDRYRVLYALGHGGMASVFAVEHAVLGTRHALKVLHSADPALRERLIREGQLQARIDPTHVVPVTDVIEIDGAPALLMPLVDGCTLAEALEQRRLSEPEAIALFAGIVAGVAAAHAAGVTHRDLKPANVLLELRGGSVTPRVADFGVAKSVDLAGATRDGAFLGTPAYSAPEQLLDASQVDHRADLWALGVILVEMLSGLRPFQGANILELTRRISTSEWDRSSISPRWLPLADALLEPDRERRMPSAAVLAERVGEASAAALTVGDAVGDLVAKRIADARRSLSPPDDRAGVAGTTLALDTTRDVAPDENLIEKRRTLALAAIAVSAALAVLAGWLWIGGTADDLPVLAVLPLAAKSTDPGEQSLGDGLALGLTERFTDLHGVRIVAETSSFRRRDGAVDPRGTAAALGAGTLLLGRLASRSDAVHVDLELVDADDGSLIWSRGFERSLAELPSLEPELALAVADALDLDVDTRERDRLGRAMTRNAEAYRHYTDAREAVDAADRTLRMLEYMQRTIDADPSFAAAYSGLAAAYARASGDAIPPEEAMPRARAAARRALELDPDLGEAYAVLGLVAARFDADADAADRAFTRALELSPGSSTARVWRGLSLLGDGRAREAAAAFDEAAVLDPLSPETAAIALWPSIFAPRGLRDPAAAIQRAASWEDRESSAAMLTTLGLAHLGLGQADEAVAALQAAVRLEPSAAARCRLAHAQAVAGERDEASSRFEELVSERSAGTWVSPYLLGLVALALGDSDRAVRLVGEAVASRDDEAALARVDPRLDALHDDARLRAVLPREESSR